MFCFFGTSQFITVFGAKFEKGSRELLLPTK